MKSRMFAALCGAVMVVTCAAGVSAHQTSTAHATAVGLARFVTTAPAGDVIGIATFDRAPNAATVARLRTSGLRVQAMKHLPLAIVKGPLASMQYAVASGAANDVYPDDHIQLLDTASSDAMGAAATRAAGFTADGVTVAVVDSGCDATHSDLADHVAHNVKLIGPEYVNERPDPNTPGDGAMVIPVEQGPYNNSDLGSGHGTHVSGIIAADGTTAPEHLGVAPDATLVCYSIGEVLFTTAVVSAYDHMLDQPNLWDIKVVNNSWGNAFRAFDPADPVNVATKAVADKGVVVVFAAGNAGQENAEVSLNPFSQAPWVISVAADDLTRVRADFSSNGAEFDNSEPVGVDKDGHASFTGTRIGLYHPDVTAPGSNISSTCDTIGVAVGPCPPDSNETASGTSMASPHVAGAAAVLLQANPQLTPIQVRMALQVTAVPVTNVGTGVVAGFWQTGYGHIDLAAAVELVRSPDFGQLLFERQVAADDAVFAATGWRIERSDLWEWDAPPVTVSGQPDTKTLELAVPAETAALKVALAYPSLGTVAANGMSYVATVTDAGGREVGVTTANFWNGSSAVFVDLRTLTGLDFSGPWTVQVSGNRAASDPDTLDSDSALGRKVTITVAQLR